MAESFRTATKCTVWWDYLPHCCVHVQELSMNINILTKFLYNCLCASFWYTKTWVLFCTSIKHFSLSTPGWDFKYLSFLLGFVFRCHCFVHNNGIAATTLVWDQHAEFSSSFFPLFLSFYISSFSLHFYNYLNKRRSSVDRSTASKHARVWALVHTNTWTVFIVCMSLTVAAFHKRALGCVLPCTASVGILCLCAAYVCVCCVFVLVPVCQVADSSQAYYQGCDRRRQAAAPRP